MGCDQRHPGLNQSAVEFERFTRHPLGPGTPSHSQDTPRVGTTLREEVGSFAKPWAKTDVAEFGDFPSS